MAIGNVYIISAIAIVGGGLFGFDISSMSAIIGTPQYKCYFNQGPIPASPDECTGPRSNVQGGITASMAGGSWLAALCSGFLSDMFGRKTSIMIGACIWVIGSIIICASQNIGMLIVGRFINGFCVGICSAQVPVYISELAPPSKRGRLGVYFSHSLVLNAGNISSLETYTQTLDLSGNADSQICVVGAQQWAITWGIMIMFYISYGSSFIKGTAAFRLPWGLQMIPAILLFIGMCFLPESPRWLARKDRWEDCHGVLTLVHGKGDPNSPFVVHELQDIKAMCEFERNNADATFLELFKPNMINRTHIGVFTQIWSQLTGMNVMMYYITYVFAMANLSGNNLLVSSSIQYVINVLLTVPALIFVDRWGRRPTLLFGALGMMTWMFANGGLLASYGHYAGPEGVNHTPEASWSISGPPSKAVIACSYLFVASYAPTWGPVSWIYPPELYPLRVRGKAVALATSANWAFNFALGYFVPPAFVNIKWHTYILFGVFNVAMFLHVLVAFPETAGKTLEEVEDMFTDPRGPKYIGTVPWRTQTATKKALLVEHGEVDPEKLAQFGHEEGARSGSETRGEVPKTK